MKNDSVNTMQDNGKMKKRYVEINGYTIYRLQKDG